MGYQHKKTLIVLVIGLMLILLPMLALVGIVVERIQSNTEELDKLVHEQNTKTQLISDMLSSARERSLLMLEMHLSDDPFLRDEMMQDFNVHGNRFARARIQLLAMNMSEIEKTILNKQGEITQAVVPVQRKIVDALTQEELPENIAELIINEAVPMQNKVFEQLGKLVDIQQTTADQSFQKAVSDTRETIITISLLAMVVFSICVLIAIYLIRYITRSEKVIFREKERAQVTLHSIGDAVITTDNRGVIVKMNDEAERLTGWTDTEAKNSPIEKICALYKEDDHDCAYYPITDVIESDHVIASKGSPIIVQRNGKEYAVEYTASPIHSSDGNIDGTIIVLRNVTEMRLLSHQLTYQATHDALTGLVNRAEFEYLTETLILESKDTDRHHALSYLDLDQFKVINDTCGHQAGDELLKQLSSLLQRELRGSDIVSRLGGDEFGIIFRDCNIDKAANVLEKLREKICSQRFVWDNKSFNMSVSAGLVGVSAQTGTLYDIFSSADSACYAAKEQGRNRIHIYKEDDIIMTTMEGQMHWVHRINKALEEDRFDLYYQTIAPLHVSNKGISCELLVRMISEEGKIIPPMAFIPSAERYNLMSNIDRWVIDKAMSMISEQATLIKDKDCHFSINLSAQSICDKNFLSFIKEQFDKYNLPAEFFCFEITETTAISNLSLAKKFISELKELGCKFSLDDFGSGLSSFEYLKNLSVDYLKIDGAFVKNLINDQVDKAMVQSINQVGHVMGIHTIAEFAENDEILKILKDIGVDYAQGYGISKPKQFRRLEELGTKK